MAVADKEREIRCFFERYALSFNNALQAAVMDVDIENTAGAFAGNFIEAGPQGITAGRNDAQFRTMIRQGYDYYRSIGVTAMNIISSEISVINEQHYMVKVLWKSCFSKKDHSKGCIEFYVTYLLQAYNGDQYRIFAYVTGDEQAALREIRLI